VDAEIEQIIPATCGTVARTEVEGQSGKYYDRPVLFWALVRTGGALYGSAKQVVGVQDPSAIVSLINKPTRYLVLPAQGFEELVSTQEQEWKAGLPTT
jgi:hypothetical protein